MRFANTGILYPGGTDNGGVPTTSNVTTYSFESVNLADRTDIEALTGTGGEKLLQPASMAFSSSSHMLYETATDSVVSLTDTYQEDGRLAKLAKFNARTYAVTWAVTLNLPSVLLSNENIYDRAWELIGLTETKVWIGSRTQSEGVMWFMQAYSLSTGALVHELIFDYEVDVGGQNLIRPYEYTYTAPVAVTDTKILFSIGAYNEQVGSGTSPHYQFYYSDITGFSSHSLSIVGPINAQDVSYPGNGTYYSPDGKIYLFYYNAASSPSPSFPMFAVIDTADSNSVTYINSDENYTPHRLYIANNVAHVDTIIVDQNTFDEDRRMIAFNATSWAELGQYGSRYFGNNNFYETYGFGDYLFVDNKVWGFSNDGTIVSWDAGQYSKDAPMMYASIDYPGQYTTSYLSANLNFNTVDLYRQYYVAGRATQFVFLPARQVPDVKPAGFLTSPPVTEGTMSLDYDGYTYIDLTSQKLAWWKFEYNGLDSMIIRGEGGQHTALVFIYDSTGRLVQAGLPSLVTRDAAAPGTYYVAFVNVIGDTTCITTAAQEGFRVTIEGAYSLTPTTLEVYFGTFRTTD